MPTNSSPSLANSPHARSLPRHLVPPLFLAGLVALTVSAPSSGQGSVEDYRRSDTIGRRTSGGLFREKVSPQWFGPDKTRFWYKVRTAQNEHEFVLVDAAAGRRQPAFDHRELAQQLTTMANSEFVAESLDLRQLSFDENASVCRFRIGNRHWEFELPAGPLRESESASNSAAEADGTLPPLSEVRRSRNSSEHRVDIRFRNRLAQTLETFWVDSQGRLRSYGIVAAKSTLNLSTFEGHAWVLKSKSGETVAAFVASASSTDAVVDVDTPRPRARRGDPHHRRSTGADSPDRRWRVRFEAHNVLLVDRDNDQTDEITTDGDEENFFGGRVWWSPDSTAFVVMKNRRGQHRMISMIESSPDGSVHPKVISHRYDKPGDRIDQPRPLLVKIDGREAKLIANDLFDNPFGIKDVRWREDSSAFSFVYNQRGHQTLRLIEVDASTATPRVVIDETSDTFVCYSSKQYLRRLDETDEAIWMSERSGWNHLYLFDTTKGEVKNAITAGEWVVRGVEKVDTETRQLWIRVSGMHRDEDPYHVHLVRINFDGSGLTHLTHGDGDHQWEFSENGRFLIDRYSRVDLPPISQLVEADSGKLLCELERADDSQLRATGWQRPERFVAKGRDGKTDIYGLVIRPTNFDPQQRYPILEAIYAGPHGAFVPKRFGRQVGLQEMAELGFIVVKMDGMGTNYRSKAFHDVCWKNLGDSGFPDRIAWIRACALDRPEMDLTRVGIWGGSAGGQSAMRALIAHHDFYHAAVADCGCHDNRVDKIWWNEQWMGWPIGSHYAEQSNVTQAHRLGGNLMLIWGELDRNVDPASTMQVIDALVRADKDFEQLIMPGVGHGAAGRPYAKRRQKDFFVRKLWGRDPRHDVSDDRLPRFTPEHSESDDDRDPQ